MRHSPSSHFILLLIQRTCLGHTMRRGTWLPKMTWLRWKSRTTLWPTQTATCWRTSPASLRCWSASTSPLWQVSGLIFPPLGLFWRLTCDRFRFLVPFDLIFSYRLFRDHGRLQPLWRPAWCPEVDPHRNHRGHHHHLHCLYPLTTAPCRRKMVTGQSNFNPHLKISLKSFSYLSYQRNIGYFKTHWLHHRGGYMLKTLPCNVYVAQILFNQLVRVIYQKGLLLASRKLSKQIAFSAKWQYLTALVQSWQDLRCMMCRAALHWIKKLTDWPAGSTIIKRPKFRWQFQQICVVSH